MSLIPAGTTIIQAAFAELLPLVFIRPRSIGGIIANVTIEETSIDRLAITDHPVEQGGVITDHSYKRPASVTIVAGWSNSSFQAGGDVDYVTQIYDALLELQASRQPFDVVTGQRTYQNMLMENLYKKTDEKTENALICICECREIQIVSTQTVVVPSSDKMKSPESNAATTRKGTVTVLPAGSFNANGLFVAQ